MEYDTSSSFSSPTDCTGTEITGLSAGTYYVRVKETATHKAGAAATVTVPVGGTTTAGQKGVANASIPEKSITGAIAKAQADAKAQSKTVNGTNVALNVTMPKGATSLTATLTKRSLDSLVSAGVKRFELNGSPVTVSFDTKALAEIQKQRVYDLTINYQKDSKDATVTSFRGVRLQFPYLILQPRMKQSAFCMRFM